MDKQKAMFEKLLGWIMSEGELKYQLLMTRSAILHELKLKTYKIEKMVEADGKKSLRTKWNRLMKKLQNKYISKLASDTTVLTQDTNFHTDYLGFKRMLREIQKFHAELEEKIERAKRLEEELSNMEETSHIYNLDTSPQMPSTSTYTVVGANSSDMGGVGRTYLQL
jgi:transcription elongation GreA/GreB family factor